MELVTHFGAPLVKLKVDSEIIDSLNHYGDQVLQKIPFPPSLDSTSFLTSEVKREFKVKKGLLDEVEAFLLKSAAEFHRRYASLPNDVVPSFSLKHMWIVSQVSGEWNYQHYHNGEISGILYLKIPNEMTQKSGEENKRAKFPGGITFSQGTPGMYQKGLMNIMPQAGELYLFPSTLMHTVYPFFGSEERRSFSFNINVNLN